MSECTVDSLTKNNSNSQSLYITDGTILTMILAKGWHVDQDSVGTVWGAINKMTYDFLAEIAASMDKRVEMLKKRNNKDKYPKSWFSCTKKIEWSQDVTIRISGSVMFEYSTHCKTGEYKNPLVNYMKIVVCNSSKMHRKSIKETVTLHINKEAEKMLK